MASKTRRSTTGGKAETTVHIKRAYDPPEETDGYRVLVDRLWPRGARKDALALDAWMKDIAPSDELRRWFGHDEARWKAFEARYREELRRAPAKGLLAELVAHAKQGPLTLVYGARDELHNQAVVLRDRISGKRGRRTGGGP